MTKLDKNKKNSQIGKLWLTIIFIGVALIIAPIIIISSFLISKKNKANSYDLDDIHKIDVASIVYDKYDKEITTIKFDNRRTVLIEEVPFHFFQALIAAEDSRFFEHKGVDTIGICRAMLRNVKAGGISQGASTITQQLARNAFDIGGRTFNRKITEAFLAARIERQFTKSQILELYLNRIYFGSGFYGLNTAALGYFGKDVSELNLSESATLCGLIKSPQRLSPINDLLKSINQRNYVLSRMYQEQMISRREFDEATSSKLPINPHQNTLQQNYVSNYIRNKTIDIVGIKKIKTGGYHIFTTIDMNAQSAAEKAIHEACLAVEKNHPKYEHQTLNEYVKIYNDYKKEVKQIKLESSINDIPPKFPLRPNPKYLQSSLLMIDNKNGAVLSVVGGRSFRHSQYDRVFNSKRSPGTAFKPFVYAAAYESGKFFPGSRLLDHPINLRWIMIGGKEGILGEWGVEKLNPQHVGYISAYEALSKGKNSATLRMGLKIGLKSIREISYASGMPSHELQYNKAILGEYNIGLPALTRAYTIFPNLGTQPNKIFIIKKILDSKGNAIFKNPRTKLNRVISQVSAHQVHSSLAQSIKNGTASDAQKLYKLHNFNGGIKTGTAYNFNDVMIFGYNSEVTCGLWAGFDLPKTIYRGAFSKDVLLKAWVDVMNAYTKNQRKIPPIPEPHNSITFEICKVSGKKATDNCYNKIPMKKSNEFKFKRTTFKIHLGKNYKNLEHCNIHYSENAEQKFDPVIPVGTNNPFWLSGEKSYIPFISPVIIKSPTIIGIDPYNSVKPNIIISKEENNTFLSNKRLSILKPKKVDKTKEKKEDDIYNILKLKPPEPIDFD